MRVARRSGSSRIELAGTLRAAFFSLEITRWVGLSREWEVVPRMCSAFGRSHSAEIVDGVRRDASQAAAVHLFSPHASRRSGGDRWRSRRSEHTGAQLGTAQLPFRTSRLACKYWPSGLWRSPGRVSIEARANPPSLPLCRHLNPWPDSS